MLQDIKLIENRQQSGKILANSQQDIFVSNFPLGNEASVQKTYSSQMASSNWNLEAESLLSEQRNVKHLPEEECTFWKDLIQSKLFPFVDENQQEEKVNNLGT